MIDDFEITPIFQCPILSDEEATTKMRLEIEQYFIETLKTYLPYGMNIAVNKFADSPAIHFSVPYSRLGQLASKIVRSHYNELQKQLPQIYPHYMVTAFSRNKNIKDMVVSAKIKTV